MEKARKAKASIKVIKHPYGQGCGTALSSLDPSRHRGVTSRKKSVVGSEWADVDITSHGEQENKEITSHKQAPEPEWISRAGLATRRTLINNIKELSKMMTNIDNAILNGQNHYRIIDSHEFFSYEDTLNNMDEMRGARKVLLHAMKVMLKIVEEDDKKNEGVKENELRPKEHQEK